MKEVSYFSSPIGVLEIQTENNKVLCVRKAKKRFKKPPRTSFMKKALDQLEAYFEEKKPMKLEFVLRGTEFEKRVLKTLYHVPFGQSLSYKELSERAGFSRAYRAVGSVCRKNDHLILIPCHRVLDSKGGLSGFRAGIKNKKWLLCHEGFYGSST